MTQEWIPVNTAKINPQIRSDVGGTTVNVLVSPHDVPIAVRGGYAADEGPFIIEFRYIDDEPWRPERRADGTVLRLGRHSRRLYGIELPRVQLQGSEVSLNLHVPQMVEKTIDDLSNTMQEHRRVARENYQVAKRAVESTQQDLFSSIAG